MARGLKLGNYEIDGLYYLCCKNKGAVQLHGYLAADLHLRFTHKQKTGFLMMQLNYYLLEYGNGPKFSDRQFWVNSADPDQTAPTGAV